MNGGKALNAGWGLMTALAVAVGVFSLRYGLPTVPHPVLTNFVTHRAALCVHAVSAAVALLAGPWQFIGRWRRSRPGVHRALGRLYTGAVLIGWVSSIPVGLHAETGALASAGFLTLGVLWVACTTVGVAAHRCWMIRSYALTAAAITRRLTWPPRSAWACHSRPPIRRSRGSAGCRTSC